MGRGGTRKETGRGERATAFGQRRTPDARPSVPRHRVRHTPIHSRPPSSATSQGATAPPRPMSPNRASNASTPTCAPLPFLPTSAATSPQPRTSKRPAPRRVNPTAHIKPRYVTVGNPCCPCPHNRHR
ncbi:hypothetical protein CPC08DRAFT_715235 [Agrocybe pediades]|nr:hypothetical protein CPC08DRAFT_715235 [Agrocybe pediades]